MPVKFRSRFSTKLVLLIAIVFLIPVITTIAMIETSTRNSVNRFDELLKAEPDVQRDGLAQLAPGFHEIAKPILLLKLLKDYEQRRSLGLMTGLAVTACVLAGVVIVLSLLILKQGMLSLKELSRAAALVGEGNFDVAPLPRSHDEFSQLTEAFQTMTRRLRETVVLRDFFNQVVESMPAAVFTVDRDGLITTWNRQAEKLTGLAARDVIMRKVSCIEDVLGPVPNIAEVPFFGRELAIRPRVGGQRTVSKGADVFFDRASRPAGIISTFVDITALKTLERELIQAKERAEESSRLRSEFLANMSHEIRTPLNGILGLAEVLLDGEADEERRLSLKTIRQCGQNLLHIINEILELSKIEAGKMLLHFAITVIEDVVKESLATVDVGCQKKGLALSWRIADDVPRAMEIDRHKLVQVLINLLGNALKFTEQGDVQLFVALYAGHRPGDIIFSVTDTGIGVPIEKQEHIFESFTQAEGHLTREGDGTGLGLAISKKLVDLMGGEIWVESELNKGSTFNFTIAVTGDELSKAHEVKR